jgi:CheY-like chemotaxis protein
MTASKGVACGDVARASIILEAAKALEGTPMRWLLEWVRKLFQTTYIKIYFRLRPVEKDSFTAWRAIMAANFFVDVSLPEEGVFVKLILSHHRSDEVRIAYSVQEVLTVAEQPPPDLIILDSELLDDEEYQQIRAIPTLQNIPNLFHDPKPPELVYRQAQRLGAAGYVPVPMPIDALLAARGAVLRGETYFPALSQ